VPSTFQYKSPENFHGISPQIYNKNAEFDISTADSKQYNKYYETLVNL
jgi:hypothetical protein